MKKCKIILNFIEIDYAELDFSHIILSIEVIQDPFGAMRNMSAMNIFSSVKFV